MSEREVRDRLRAAIGQPPEATVRRLEAHLYATAVRERELPDRRRRPRGTAVLAVAMAALIVGGLLATQLARRPRPAPVPAGVPTAATASPPGCRAGAPAQLIVIDLAAQRLTAYDHGCTFLTTPVTTGGPATPTARGTFHVIVKDASRQLVSPWPRASPHWYPATTVQDYVGFSAAGDALHSAEWEPAAVFGAGSESGPYASHGTVHVPTAALQRLYAWVDIGARVEVRAGS